MDFFTLPTVTFGILYYFSVFAHNRRRILYYHEDCTHLSLAKRTSSGREAETNPGANHKEILKPGSRVCIIPTFPPLELMPREYRLGVEEKRREKCVYCRS